MSILNFASSHFAKEKQKQNAFQHMLQAQAQTPTPHKTKKSAKKRRKLNEYIEEECEVEGDVSEGEEQEEDQPTLEDTRFIADDEEATLDSDLAETLRKEDEDKFEERVQQEVRRRMRKRKHRSIPLRETTREDWSVLLHHLARKYFEEEDDINRLLGDANMCTNAKDGGNDCELCMQQEGASEEGEEEAETLEATYHDNNQAKKNSEKAVVGIVSCYMDTKAEESKGGGESKALEDKVYFSRFLQIALVHFGLTNIQWLVLANCNTIGNRFVKECGLLTVEATSVETVLQQCTHLIIVRGRSYVPPEEENATTKDWLSEWKKSGHAMHQIYELYM
jgi:hypothetical protein